MASISSLFGYILNFIYNLVQNYGLSIIIFSVLLKLILLPISIKQQKTMKKSAKIQEKVKEIQDKYKNDPQKMNQEMMDLYKKENMSPFSGCLSSIIQIVLLLAMFGLVRNPLTYMLKVDSNTVNGVANYIKEESEENHIDQAYPQISILKYVSKNQDKTIDLNRFNYEEQKEENAVESIRETNNVNLKDLYINMNFLGMDLSNIPKENWNDWTVFVIPALYVLTSMLSMRITTMMTNKNKNKDIIEIKNEDESEEKLSAEEMTAQMSKSMTWFMPIMSVSISLIAPLGLALYWLVNNILMITERLVLNRVLKPEEEEKQNG